MVSSRIRFDLVLALLVFGLTCTYCVNLESDGGYNIVVGITNEVAERGKEPLEYVDKLKRILEDFARFLWSSTDGIFHIKSIQILVPESWAVQLNADDAITASYSTVEILISNSTLVPRSENYYPCGKPGQRIHLPIDFIESPTSDRYGPQAKGLLNLWLRYRFGVWEEHGYPNHTVTPYFYQTNAVDHTEWKLTSCNNSELNGKYVSLSYMHNVDPLPSNDSCSTNGNLTIDQSCHFIPHEGMSLNNATTSIMNFHWLESVVKLCDKYTHDKYTPNRQNLYCNHRSVWEVIRSTWDYKRLNRTVRCGNSSDDNDSPEVPEIEFSIVTESSKPLLYILLDIGHPAMTIGSQMYEIWLNELMFMLKSIEQPETGVIAKLSTFHRRENHEVGLTPCINWTQLNSDGVEDLISCLDFQSEISNGHYGFHVPLFKAIEELKIRKHPSGAVLLLLRNRDEPRSVGIQGLHEEDLNLDLKLYGIMLFEIHVTRASTASWTTHFKLDYLVSESGGQTARIEVDDLGIGVNSTHEPQDMMRPALNGVVEALKQGITRTREYSLIYRTVTPLRTSNSILIPKRDDVELLHVYVTSSFCEFSEIRFRSENITKPFTRRPQWDVIREGRWEYGQTYYKTMNVSALTVNDSRMWELEIRVPRNNLVTCVINIYGSNPTNEPTPRTPKNTLNVEIFTSTDEYKQYACRDLQEEPLAVFVKLVGQNNTPVMVNTNATKTTRLKQQKLAQYGGTVFPSKLQAELVNAEFTYSCPVLLNDDGFGADLNADDGVYSGYAYPYFVGLYRVYVNLYDMEESVSYREWREQYPIGTLLSKKQDNLEVEVYLWTLNTPYSMFKEMASFVHVTFGCVDKRFISRVTDAHAKVTANDTELVKVTFTVPLMLKSETANAAVDEQNQEGGGGGYLMGMVRLSEKIDDLMVPDEDAPPDVFMIEMSSVGEVEEVFLKRKDALYARLELLDFSQPPSKSSPSNLIRIEGWPIFDEETPFSLITGCGVRCVVGISVSSGLAIFLLLGISIALWKKNRLQKNQIRLLSREEVREFLHGQQTKKCPDSVLDHSDFIQSLPYDSQYEIPSTRLHIDRTELLGLGTFGEVFKGYVVGMPGGSGKVLTVAVKTMKSGMDKLYFKALLAEVKLMTHIGSSHPNIVKLVGACTANIRKCQVFLATEFCPNGNLLSYLQKLNGKYFQNLIDEQGILQAEKGILGESEISTSSLIKWAREIANGMEYLGQKRIIHGDLAARNILLDEKLIAKISDFGLSKQLLQYSKYAVENAGGLLPWKWLAPETLQFMKFSFGSDIWAYGVTIWEIFSLGQIPYPGVKWSPEFVNQLEQDGLRLLKPSFATHAIYQMMLDCWKLEPSQRPSFYKLKMVLDQMMVMVSPSDYMEVMDTNEYKNVNYKVTSEVYIKICN